MTSSFAGRFQVGAVDVALCTLESYTGPNSLSAERVSMLKVQCSYKQEGPRQASSLHGACSCSTSLADCTILAQTTYKGWQRHPGCPPGSMRKASDSVDTSTSIVSWCRYYLDLASGSAAFSSSAT